MCPVFHPEFCIHWITDGTETYSTPLYQHDQHAVSLWKNNIACRNNSFKMHARYKHLHKLKCALPSDIPRYTHLLREFVSVIISPCDYYRLLSQSGGYLNLVHCASFHGLSCQSLASVIRMLFWATVMLALTGPLATPRVNC